jgi:hypothetical protein
LITLRLRIHLTYGKELDWSTNTASKKSMGLRTARSIANPQAIQLGSTPTFRNSSVIVWATTELQRTCQQLEDANQLSLDSRLEDSSLKHVTLIENMRPRIRWLRPEPKKRDITVISVRTMATKPSESIVCYETCGQQRTFKFIGRSGRCTLQIRRRTHNA